MSMRHSSMPADAARPVSPPASLSTFYSRRGKRLVDLSVGAPLTVLFSPFIGALALVVCLTSGRPIFFVQERVGLYGRRFGLIKFRTMVPDAMSKGAGLYIAEKDERITWAGRWLRLTSLDELPQIVNVMKGDLSLVGPRPNLPMIVERYGESYREILLVRPGLTGLAAVRGRHLLRRSQMLALDREYVATLSFRSDLRILFATVPVVLFRHGSAIVRSAGFIEDVAAEDPA
jgi:lipopolysaccharide/colanic/teichoic acid biosynthesis glycosyltransferase